MNRQFNRRKFLTGAGAGLTLALLPRAARAASINNFADGLSANLSGRSVGFQLTASDMYGTVTGRAGGYARLPQDLPLRQMSNSEKYHSASVSKTITAAALLKVLTEKKISIGESFVHYLPSHWYADPSLKYVTFKQLLQHESGFRFNSGVSYAELKTDMLAGINVGNVGIDSYNNNNYGIMRLLIPRLAGYNLPVIPPNTAPGMLQILEPVQAAQMAVDYMDYVQKKIWAETQVALAMTCKPVGTYPGFCYQAPPTAAHGTAFSDATLTSGSQGWVASSFQLNAFQRTLHHSVLILPQYLSNMMAEDGLGYDGTPGNTKTGHTYYQKGGYYPGSSNPGELHTYLVGFSNGVHVAVIINSPFNGDLLGSIIKAFEAAYK